MDSFMPKIMISETSCDNREIFREIRFVVLAVQRINNPLNIKF